MDTIEEDTPDGKQKGGELKMAVKYSRKRRRGGGGRGK